MLPTPRCLTASALSLLLIAFLVLPASATFPQVPIDGDLFDPESEIFLRHNFGFGTSLQFQDFGSTDPPATTGLKGFVASPEQVGAIPNFASGSEEPLGGHDLDDLFPAQGDRPDSLNQGEVSQGISGVGGFSNGFNSVQINQRKRLGSSQSDGAGNLLEGEAIGYAPFEVFSESEEEVLARFTVDLFSQFLYGGEGSVSETIIASLIDKGDPEAPVLKNGITGFYSASGNGLFASFSKAPTGEDLTENLFIGPLDQSVDSPDVASFFYQFDAVLDPTKSYALGLSSFGEAGQGQGSGFADLDSGGTVSFSIEVLTPNATIVLPGFVPVPEPGTLSLVGLGCFALGIRRGGCRS